MFTCFTNIIIHKGTKNVAKSMSKIAVGSQKNAGKTWFPELADKRMLIGIQYIMPIICRKEYKVHLYYCMKNCANSADMLRSSI